MNYAVLSSDGKIQRTVACTEAHTQLQCGPGEAVVELPASISQVTHYYGPSGWMEYPARPSLQHTFNFDLEIWEDTSTAADRAERLQTAKASAHYILKREVNNARSKYVTDLLGQDMIYLAKEAEAKRWLADEAPDHGLYPLLLAEIGLTAPDPDQLAQIWLNMADMWRNVAASLEPFRMQISDRIGEAASKEEVDDIVREIQEFAEGLP